MFLIRAAVLCCVGSLAALVGEQAGAAAQAPATPPSVSATAAHRPALP